MLIRDGAEINARNQLDETPLDKARKHEINVWLASLGATSNANDTSTDDVDDLQFIRRVEMNERVKQWLTVELSLPEYVENFMSNGYDRFDAVLSMDKADLTEIGVKAGHIKIISAAIGEHKAGKVHNDDVDYTAVAHKKLGQKYFEKYLQKQKESLKIPPRFVGIRDTQQSVDLVKSLDECLYTLLYLVNERKAALPNKMLFEIAGRLLKQVCDEMIEQVTERVRALTDSDSAIGMAEAQNISLCIAHVVYFVLGRDLAHLTRDFEETWQRFTQSALILDAEYSLKLFTRSLENGRMDVFLPNDLVNILCALWSESEKRETVVHAIQARLNSAEATQSRKEHK